ncbi:MAG: GNAT family N-acetyltransferase [Alphaproteobacteria bacterium]
MLKTLPPEYNNTADYRIIPIQEQHIESFWYAADAVMRERKYLAFLEAPPLAETKEYIVANIKKQNPHWLLVDHAEQVWGWCDITRNISRPVTSHSGTLGIGILADLRGKGWGKKLMQTAINDAWQKGFTRISLTVFEHNKRAITLYQQLGFAIEGLHKNSILMDGNYINQYSMGLLPL